MRNWSEVIKKNPILGVVGQNPHQLARFVFSSGNWKLICDDKFKWELSSIFSPYNCPDTEMAAKLVLDVLDKSIDGLLDAKFVYNDGKFVLDVEGMRDAPSNFPYPEVYKQIKLLESGVPTQKQSCPILQSLIQSISSSNISGADKAAYTFKQKETQIAVCA